MGVLYRHNMPTPEQSSNIRQQRFLPGIKLDRTDAALLGAMLLIVVGGGVPVTPASALPSIGWMLYLGT